MNGKDCGHPVVGGSRLLVIGAVLLGCLALTGCGAKSAAAPTPAAPEPTVVAPPTPKTETYYAVAHDFSDGVAWVQTEEKDGWDAIDSSGTVLFSLSGDESPLTDFVDGGAVVSAGMRKDGSPIPRIVGKTGSTLFPDPTDENDYIYVLSVNGDTFVTRTISTIDKTENQTGIVGGDGKWIVEPTPQLQVSRFDDAVEGIQSLDVNELPDSEFYKGPGWSKKTIYGDNYYDSNTNTFFESGTPGLGNPDTNLHRRLLDYLYHDDLIYLVNSNGLENPAVSGNAGYFDMRKLGFKGTKTGFYDRSKKLVIDFSKYPSAQKVGDFSDGYCSVILDNPQGDTFETIIDKTGRQMFEPRSGISLGAFSRGLAFLSDAKGGTGYIDAAGKSVITGITTGFPFGENGVAMVQDNPGDGTPVSTYFIDRAGDIAF